MSKIDDGYRDLANAIILQAVSDYRKARGNRKSQITKFFWSSWCDFLLPEGITGKDIHRRLVEENKEKYKQKRGS